MTTRRLPDQDLARIAPMPYDQKRRELEEMKGGRPPYSYKPVRQCNLDILNVTAGPLASGLPRTPWEKIDAEIRRVGKSDEEIHANLRVARGAFDFAELNDLTGYRHEFYPLNVGIPERISYWSNAYVLLDGRPVVPFFDFRRTKTLTAKARQFVFSVMHERVRVGDPDFADARLAIISFANAKVGPRQAYLSFDDEFELLDVDQLETMIRETYEIWAEVLDDRKAEARRRGGSGSLL